MPRAMTAKQRHLLLLGLLAALLIPLFLAVPTHLRHDPVIGPLGSRYHVALFFALTLLLYHYGPLRGRLRRVVLVGLLLGALTELVQTRFGRSATLNDWALDAQGVGFAVCWLGLGRARWRRLALAGGAVLTVLLLWPLRHMPVTVPEVNAARARFPLLDDFERPGTLALWHSHQGGELRLAAEPGRGHVLQVDSAGDERWPGAASRKLPWDWTGRTELVVDCRLVAPSPDSLRISVWVEDRARPGDVDDALMTFTVDHAWQTLVVPLDALSTRRRGRPVSGREILGVAIFASRREPGPLALQIDDLRLR